MVDWSRIEFFCGEADRHLNEIEAVKTSLQNVRDLLYEIKELKEKECLDELQEIKDQVNFLTEYLRERGLTPTDKYEMELIEIKKLLSSDNWPEAVEPELICDENDKNELLEASNGVLNSVVSEYLKDMTVLDIGCGPGCLSVATLNQHPSKVVAYDIKEHAFWDSLKMDYPSINFTTSMDVVQEEGPYDIVIMHDVIDHIIGDPVRILKDISDVMDKQGKLFVVCHPWCSRHGSHIYKKLNKAFVHLVLDETELMRLYGIQMDHVINVIYPLKQYEEWFSEAGFKILDKSPKFTKVETFFKNNKLNKRIMKNWPTSEATLPEYHMSIDFVTYVLQPSYASKLSEII